MEICNANTVKNVQCNKTFVIEIDNNKYCTRHYKKYVRNLKQTNNNIELKYKNKILNCIKDANILYQSIDYICFYENIFTYSILINSKKYILKIQLLDNGGVFTLSYEHHLIQLFNSYKLNTDGYIYKPKKYFIIIQEEYKYFVKDIIETLSDTEKNKILTDLLLLIKKIHNLDYMYLNLCLEYLIIKNNDTVDLLIYSPSTRYLNNLGELCANKKIEKFMGDPDFGSINICSYNSGVRMDDIESIIWIKLALFNNEIINKIKKANSLERILIIKKEFLDKKIEIYDYTLYSGMLNYNDLLKSILYIN